jgi:HPt (histidine-containing phosphotransfer) domain-containing protein
MTGPIETARDYFLTELRFPEEEVEEILALGRRALFQGLGRVVSALGVGDARRASEQAHLVKGILRNMGLFDPGRIARRVEELAETGSLAEARTALRELCCVLEEFSSPDCGGLHGEECEQIVDRPSNTS